MSHRNSVRSSAPARSAQRKTSDARKAGSRSPGHRGYRAEEAAPASGAHGKKPRWNAEQRQARGLSSERPRGERDRAHGGVERDGDHPDWTPRDKRRPGRGAPVRHGDRPNRAGDPRGRGAARREDGGEGRGYRGASGRAERYDRTERDGRSDRPVREDRYARPAREDRYGRPAREDRYGRPAREGRRDDHDRPARDDRHDRSVRDDRRADRADRSIAAPHTRRRDGFGPDPRDDQNDSPRRGGHARTGHHRETAAPEFAQDVVHERLQAAATSAADVEGLTFADLGLGDNIVRTLAELGATAPFPIQGATIPEVLAGRDVLGRGRTGSGKTIAFGAPLVERLLRTKPRASGTDRRSRGFGRNPRALILAPTRELALQLDRTVQPIARSVGLFTTQIYGGVPQGRQVGALQRGVDIVIGTPGRIEDLVDQGRLDLSEVEMVVLDEADHMCELGFLEPVQRIIRLTAEGGQRMLFSATLDAGVAELVEEFLVDPAVHEVAGETQDAGTIDHRVLLIDQREKRQIIEELASGEGKVLVFARTRSFAEELADQLDDAGIAAVSLHGDLNQARRTRNLEKLTSGRVRVLVATDVAARGIHVDDIALVIQADPADDHKAYLHRAGRTGRAGRQGTVVTLVNERRRRRTDELLERAEIVPVIDRVRPGDRLLAELAAL